MSSTNYITSIPIFNGIQGKFYMIDGVKYHICFPIKWAIDHLREADLQFGPIGCGNCAVYGSIRGVFVGYCSNCITRRGTNLFPAVVISHLENEHIWQQYPYMYGIDKSEIGDEEINAGYDVYMQNHVDTQTTIEYISSDSDSDTVVPEYIDEEYDIEIE